jgi:hypothetical protein
MLFVVILQGLPVPKCEGALFALIQINNLSNVSGTEGIKRCSSSAITLHSLQRR